jgi:hypothetical protein
MSTRSVALPYRARQCPLPYILTVEFFSTMCYLSAPGHLERKIGRTERMKIRHRAQSNERSRFARDAEEPEKARITDALSTTRSRAQHTATGR